MIQLDTDKFTDLLTDKIGAFPGAIAQLERSKFGELAKKLLDDPNVSGEAVKASISALPADEQQRYKLYIRMIQELHPGVDEDKAGHVTYRGFKSRPNGLAKLRRVKEAWARMGDLLTTCNRYMTYVRDPSLIAGFGMARPTQSDEEKRAIELYKTWFDASLKSSRIATVRKNFTDLFKAVTAQNFEIICDGDPEAPRGPCGCERNWFGFVMKSDQRHRFYVCDSFFNELAQQMGGSCSLSVAPRTGQTWHAAKSSIFTALDASVITMLHELTHIQSLTDTDDVQPDPYGIPFCQNLAKNYPDHALDNAENYAQFAKSILLKLQFAPPRAVRI